MIYKRVLTIQDISCVGQCSMTVALPILSACGLETCILPTALLSTHTGGFGKPSVVHFDGALEAFRKHWQENGITFDAILVGYLGSLGAVDAAEQILDTMLAPGGVAIVDPAMADHGKLYSGFDGAYAQAIGRLCRKADIIIPNVTEAAILSGKDYSPEFQDGDIRELLKALDHPCVVLTGAVCREEMTGVAVKAGYKQFQYAHKRLERSYHGTGDIFAAGFTGALMQGKTLEDAVRIAADFTCLCIENTQKAPAHWYGVKFETALSALIQMIG